MTEAEAYLTKEKSAKSQVIFWGGSKGSGVNVADQHLTVQFVLTHGKKEKGS